MDFSAWDSANRNSGQQEFRTTGIPDNRNSGQEQFRTTGIPDNRNSGQQEFRTTGIPEARSPDAGLLDSARATPLGINHATDAVCSTSTRGTAVRATGASGRTQRAAPRSVRRRATSSRPPVGDRVTRRRSQRRLPLEPVRRAAGRVRSPRPRPSPSVCAMARAGSRRPPRNPPAAAIRRQSGRGSSARVVAGDDARS